MPDALQILRQAASALGYPSSGPWPELMFEEIQVLAQSFLRLKVFQEQQQHS